MFKCPDSDLFHQTESILGCFKTGPEGTQTDFVPETRLEVQGFGSLAIRTHDFGTSCATGEVYA
jgi:hypothetical protein